MLLNFGVMTQFLNSFFSINSKEVLEESLFLVNSSREKKLYDRQGDQISFDDSLITDESLRQRLQFMFESTWDNQLFLTNIGSHKLASQIPEELKSVYKWFKETLRLISPDTYFQAWELLEGNKPFSQKINRILAKLDTGISRLDFEDTPIPNEMKSTLRDQILGSPNKSKYIKLVEYDQLSGREKHRAFSNYFQKR